MACSLHFNLRYIRGVCMKIIKLDTSVLRKALDGSTHASNIEQCGGGVGRNMAEALWRLRGGRTRLLTAVGDDADGHYLDSIAPGLLLDGCMIKNGRTPTYAAVLDSKGECLLGLGDMALHNRITPDLVNKHMKVLEESPLVVIDGNVPQATIDHVLDVCDQLQKPVRCHSPRSPGSHERTYVNISQWRIYDFFESGQIVIMEPPPNRARKYKKKPLYVGTQNADPFDIPESF